MTKVMRAIKSLECSKEFGAANFGETSYLDSWNRRQKAYLITRDGFSFLAMGFTGKEAACWKELYIRAFNAMEEELKKQFQVPQTYCEALLLAANQAKLLEEQ